MDSHKNFVDLINKLTNDEINSVSIKTVKSYKHLKLIVDRTNIALGRKKVSRIYTAATNSELKTINGSQNTF